MNKKYGVGFFLIVVVIVFSYWLGAQHKDTLPPLNPQQQFNPALVAEKEKCQAAFSNGVEKGNFWSSSHFNSKLNTCLISTLEGDGSSVEVFDIYDGYRVLLELKMSAHQYQLYENGQKINTLDNQVASVEYQKREAVLFEK